MDSGDASNVRQIGGSDFDRVLHQKYRVATA
jgi:hypothetical protein